MKRFAVVLAVFALFAAAPAHATLIPYNVVLDGTQEPTPSGSPGSGFATLVLDDVVNTLLVNLTYSGLISTTTNAHIHCCAPPNVAGPVIIPFIPAGFVTGATSGSFSSLFTGLTTTQVSQLKGGLSYINIHTQQFPAGEIRGQIVSAVPEPSSLTLLALGLAGLVRRVWRRG